MKKVMNAAVIQYRILLNQVYNNNGSIYLPRYNCDIFAYIQTCED